jgi:hypothetical protein
MARPRAKRQRRRICPFAGKRDGRRRAGDAPEPRAKGRLSGHHSRPATSPGRTGGLAAVDPSAESWRSERQVRARLCEYADRRIFRARTDHLAAHSRHVEHAAFAQLGRLGILLRDILAWPRFHTASTKRAASTMPRSGRAEQLRMVDSRAFGALATPSGRSAGVVLAS